MLTAALDAHAVERAERLAYRYMPTGEIDERTVLLDYATMRARATAVAAAIRQHVEPGERALLLYTGGTDFVIALLGCFYAGVIGVPTYPPDPRRLIRTLPRLQAIADDAEATVVVTTAALQAEAEPLCQQVERLRTIPWIASDTVPLAPEFDAPPPKPDDVAYLQYTSGSTGTPKGVTITQATVGWNAHEWLVQWPYDEESHQVTWLPAFHDLGLVWGLLTPLLRGIPCTFMDPTAFVLKPVRWLDAITRFKGTSTASPTFGFELCNRKVTAEDLERLDLSSMRAAMIAAEPVRPRTVEGFIRKFGAVGFEARAMCPCYGLAEATLELAASTPERLPVIVALSNSALEQDRVVLVDRDDPDALPATGSGQEISDTHIAIVDPDTFERTPPDVVGEIWSRGPGVALGYWGRPEATKETFHAQIAGEPERWMRTGDLGFMLDKELFITGRIKDLIIVRGRNLYPQDLELAAEDTHAAIRPGCVAAFPLDIDDEERIGIIAEIDLRKLAPMQPADLVAPIQQALADQFEVTAQMIQLIGKRTIPKTSSGKIQRRKARDLYRSEGWEVVHLLWEAPVESDEANPPGALAEALEALAPDRRPAHLTAWLADAVGAMIGKPASAIPATSALWDLGVDSVGVVTLTEHLSRALSREVHTEVVFDYSTISALVGYLLEPDEAAETPAPAPTAAASTGDVAELSDAEAEAALLAEL